MRSEREIFQCEDGASKRLEGEWAGSAANVIYWIAFER